MSVHGTATVGFHTESFTWSDGVFDLRGSWAEDAAGLGRVRLLVSVHGRRRDIGAQGGKQAGGERWRARFMCGHAPDADAPAALKAGDAEIALPAPELRQPVPAPEEPRAATGDAAALLEALQAERAALDIARQRLARERRAAEEVEARLIATRRRLGPPEKPEAAEVSALGYAVAGAIALLFALMLIVVL